ncbi:MAG: serine hydrolase domain-containing protein [Rudaea sp.]|uniref:serine hydrolase domain-containing protein n=1 Tax=Rudaea sp. TaxID=2136325 RepID=UPI0039E60EA9
MTISPLHKLAAMTMLALASVTADAGTDTDAAANPFAMTDRIFEEFRLDAHVPGLVYGVVVDGHLVHVGASGVQDVDRHRPVGADSLFRIASMTKAFTALTVLKLRDDGLLRLDEPAEHYVPELRHWKYPTGDSPKIRVRDLLSHSAGLVTDDPWGDRQLPLSEQEFTRFLSAGVPFTRAPGLAYEYSNLGYALLGRSITNTSGHPYAQTIESLLLRPLRMNDSGFVADAAPIGRRALGYRWEDDAWRAEPTQAAGAFGAVGGIQTSANDYAKWVAFLLSAWPARDDADAGPVKRASVRELAQGSNFVRLTVRPGHSAPESCRQAIAYGMGMQVVTDCELGTALAHSGGLPGYGSYVLLLPNRGVGVFAFANRTYAAPIAPVWDAVVGLMKSGQLPGERSLPPGVDLMAAYRTVAHIYASGGVEADRGQLAMNFLMDRSADAWKRTLAKLKNDAGECDTSAPIIPGGALTGSFAWRCSHGRIKGNVQLAPTLPPRIQKLELAVVAP